MASNPQIISDLRVIMETQHSLELMNTYKGVPFICRGKVTRIGEEQVQVETTEPTIACLIDQKQVKVLGSDYFEPSVASIISVDLSKGQVTLTNFSYMGSKLGERMIVRVEPKEQVPVHIENESISADGYLLDLSISGIGVMLSHERFAPTLRPGTAAQISMTLPNGAVNVSATVLSDVRAADGHRLSFRFTQDGQPKVTIFRYLVDRRVEIEHELLERYQRELVSRYNQMVSGDQPAQARS